MKWIAIAVLTLGMCVAQERSDPATPRPGQMSEETQSTPSNPKNESKRSEPLEVIGSPPVQATDELERFWRLIEILLIGALVYFAREQSKTGKKQSETGEKLSQTSEHLFRLERRMHNTTHRPELKVRNIVIPELVERIKQNSSSGKSWEFEVFNAGGTAAKLVTARSRLFDFFTREGLPMQRPIIDKREDQAGQGITIASGESRRIKIPVRDIDNDTISRIRDRTPPNMTNTDKDAYVLGFLRYRDSDGLERETRFCRKLDIEKLRFYPVDDPDYEYEG